MSIVAVVCYPSKMVDRSINQLFDSDDLHTLHMIHAEDIPDIDKAISDINEKKQGWPSCRSLSLARNGPGADSPMHGLASICSSVASIWSMSRWNLTSM